MRGKCSRINVLLFLVSWLSVMACAGGGGGASFGSVALSVTAADVARVRLEISAPHIPQPLELELERVGAQWGGLID